MQRLCGLRIEKLDGKRSSVLAGMVSDMEHIRVERAKINFSRICLRITYTREAKTFMLDISILIFSVTACLFVEQCALSASYFQPKETSIP